MLVGRNGMQAKATVGRGVNWQGVVMAHQDRLAVAHHQQLGRESAVEGPQRFVVLQRHVRMEACVDALGGAQRGRNVGGLVVQASRGEFTDGIVVQLLAVAQAEVDARTGLGGLERCLRVELVPALVRPAFSWWPAFSGRADRLAVEEHLDLRLPWVAVQHVGVLGRERVQAGLLEERFQSAATGSAACHHVGVLRGAAPRVGTGKVRSGTGVVGSSFSDPNSSNSNSCWVNGCAPNNGLGLPLVGYLSDVCRAGGSTLSVRTVLRSPYTPSVNSSEPSLASGMVFSSSKADVGSSGWSV